METHTDRSWFPLRSPGVLVALVLIISLRPKGVFGTWELTPANLRKLFNRKNKEKEAA